MNSGHRAPILVVLHQERSSAGRVGQILAANGFPLDIRKPPLGDCLPDSLENHSGAIIFGGPMSANDHSDYIRRETDWIDIPLAEDKPFLGICLGAQMLVRKLGGTVRPADNGHAEIGWFPLHATREGEKLIEWPSMVYHFHREGFSLPREATLLATAETYPNQAFRYATNAWGIQFHAELTRAMMHRWIVHGAHRFEMPGAQIGREHLEGRMLWDRAMRRWLVGFLGIVFGTQMKG